MASVSPRALKRFIQSILKDADLTKLSSKMIRKRCEDKFKVELTSKKQEIDKIIMSCIDEHNESKGHESVDVSDESDSSSSSSSDEDDSESDNDSSGDKPPVKVKRSSCVTISTSNGSSGDKPPKVKRSSCVTISTSKVTVTESKRKKLDESDLSSDTDNDAAVARKLQEEEWNFRRRAAKKMGNKKTNASNKKKSGSGTQPKARKGNSSYTRKCQLSAELAAVMNANEMARHDVVKKMWSVVRERNLFDPKNKRFAICDEQLKKIFGTKRVRMFGMMKRLQKHIKDVK